MQQNPVLFLDYNPVKIPLDDLQNLSLVLFHFQLRLAHRCISGPEILLLHLERDHPALINVAPCSILSFFIGYFPADFGDQVIEGVQFGHNLLMVAAALVGVAAFMEEF